MRSAAYHRGTYVVCRVESTAMLHSHIDCIESTACAPLREQEPGHFRERLIAERSHKGTEGWAPPVAAPRNKRCNIERCLFAHPPGRFVERSAPGTHWRLALSNASPGTSAAPGRFAGYDHCRRTLAPGTSAAPSSAAMAGEDSSSARRAHGRAVSHRRRTACAPRSGEQAPGTGSSGNVSLLNAPPREGRHTVGCAGDTVSLSSR